MEKNCTFAKFLLCLTILTLLFCISGHAQVPPAQDRRDPIGQRIGWNVEKIGLSVEKEGLYSFLSHEQTDVPNGSRLLFVEVSKKESLDNPIVLGYDAVNGVAISAYLKVAGAINSQYFLSELKKNFPGYRETMPGVIFFKTPYAEVFAMQDDNVGTWVFTWSTSKK